MLDDHNGDSELGFVVTLHALWVSDYSAVVNNGDQVLPPCSISSNILREFVLYRGLIVLVIRELHLECKILGLNGEIWLECSCPDGRDFLVPDILDADCTQDCLDRVLDFLFIGWRRLEGWTKRPVHGVDNIDRLL